MSTGQDTPGDAGEWAREHVEGGRREGEREKVNRKKVRAPEFPRSHVDSCRRCRCSRTDKERTCRWSLSSHAVSA